MTEIIEETGVEESGVVEQDGEIYVTVPGEAEESDAESQEEITDEETTEAKEEQETSDDTTDPTHEAEIVKLKDDCNHVTSCYLRPERPSSSPVESLQPDV